MNMKWLIILHISTSLFYFAILPWYWNCHLFMQRASNRKDFTKTNYHLMSKQPLQTTIIKCINPANMQHSNNYRSCKPMDKLCRKLPPKTSESTGVRTAWIQPVGMKTVWPCLMTALHTNHNSSNITASIITQHTINTAANTQLTRCHSNGSETMLCQNMSRNSLHLAQPAVFVGDAGQQQQCFASATQINFPISQHVKLHKKIMVTDKCANGVPCPQELCTVINRK